MDLDTDKIDAAVLALLYLGLHDDNRAWKGFDWDATDRLHQQGFIGDPRGKAKSIVFTDKGLARARALLETFFCKQAGPGPAAIRPRWSIAPYFITDDVVATANYYRDMLGFQYERFWGEPPCFTMVDRSGVVIMLSQLDKTGLLRPNRLVDAHGEAWDAYVWIDNADALHAEFAAKGVKITRGVCDQPYGCRDFDVEDCNGYRLCFGHNLER